MYLSILPWNVSGGLTPVFLYCLTQQSRNYVGDLERQKRRDGIANLMILPSPAAVKKVVVRKSLKSRSLPHRQRSTLCRVRVDEVVPILGDVAGYSSRRAIFHVGAKAVRKMPCFPVLVIGLEKFGELRQPWGSVVGFGK